MDDLDSWIQNAGSIINGLREFHSAPPLEWSDECFEAARAQADECQQKQEVFHGNLDGPSGRHGQTLLYSEDPIDEWVKLEDVVDKWYVDSENYCFVDPGPQEECKYLTQLLWADSSYFGIACSDDGKYIVANFWPAGNIEGEYKNNVGLPEYQVPQEVEDLGMKFGALPPNNLVVREVFEDTWAADEGIKEGDRFVAVNGVEVVKMDEREFKQQINVRPLFLRLFVGVDAEEDPGPEGAEEGTGSQVAELNKKRKLEFIADESVEKVGLSINKGNHLEVRRVAAGSWAEEQGIVAGDIFMEINGLRAHQLTFEKVIDLLKNKRPLTLVLPTEEEREAALKIQCVARKTAATKQVKAMKRYSSKEKFNDGPLNISDWRLARGRLAKLEFEKEIASPDPTHQDNALKIPRADLISKIFELVDTNTNEVLEEAELLQFAQALNYPGELDQWKEEFSHLKEDYEWDTMGINEFTTLVSDEESNPFYCGSDMLCEVLQNLERMHAATKLQSMQRGRMARKRVQTMTLTERQRDVAALKIQSRFRGNQARKVANTKKEAAKKQEAGKTEKAKAQANKADKTKAQAKQTNKAKAQAEKEDTNSGWFGGVFGGGAEAEPAEASPTTSNKETVRPKAKFDTSKSASSSTLGAKAKAKAPPTDDKKKVQVQVAKSKASPAAKYQAPAFKTGGARAPVSKTATKPLPEQVPPKKWEQNKESEDLRRKQALEQRQREEAARKIQSIERGKQGRKDLDVRQQVFLDLDLDEDGRLNQEEMFEFAKNLGFPDNEAAWEQEYKELCQQHGFNEVEGVTESQFLWLTKNPEEQYWFDAAKYDKGGWQAASADFEKVFKPPGAVTGEKAMAMPIQAKIKGIDWAKLEGNPEVKERMLQNICAALAEEAGVNVQDLQVSSIYG